MQSKSISVQVKLEGKALDIVLDEQSKYVKKGEDRGKERVINLLLTELSERRIWDTIAEQKPVDNAQWRKYLKK